MTPVGAVDDLGDRLPSDSEEGAEIHGAFASGGSFSYLANLIGSEPGCSYSLSDSLPPLGISVGHVVGLRSKEQMSGFNAEGLVAMVENILSRRDRAERLGIGHPVSAEEFPAPAHLTVAASVGAFRPEDASVHDGMVAQ